MLNSNLVSPQAASALICLTLMLGLGVSVWLHIRWSRETQLRRQLNQPRARQSRSEVA